IGETAVKLTRTEYAILKLLMQNSGQVITKSLMLERISGDTPDCTDNSLKMHISNLRRKLLDVNGKNYIEAVWGIGFKLCLEDDSQCIFTESLRFSLPDSLPFRYKMQA
ncbi:MAG: winged helix-turn-helix domain-containing protein, partial [Lachnospiraceae bacterium]|nr:winged helix-turn-helix domain-containing protein [Lachnospiraceae bacterium]